MAALSLHRAEHESLVEVFLHKGIRAQNRHGGNDDYHILKQVCEPHGADHGFVVAQHVRLRLVDDEDVAQHQLQGHQVVVADVNQRVVIRVPLRHGRPQADHRQHGLGERQRDLEEIAQVAAAVDAGRVPQVSGQVGGKEHARHDDVVHRNGKRQNQHPERIVQPKVQNHRVGGDQAPIKEHGEHVIRVEQAAAHQILARKRVSHGHVHRQAHQHAQHRVGDGVAVANPEIRALAQLDVAVHVQPLGPEEHFAVGHQRGVAERGDQNEIQRIEHDQQRYPGERVEESVEGDIPRAHAFFLFAHVLFPLLQDAGVAQVPGDLVHQQQKHQVHQRVE